MRARGWVVGAATALAAAVATLPAAPATAGDVVVVRGTGFEGHEAELSFAGCEELYRPAQETLQPRIGRGPGRAPLGTRSLGYDLAGGNAVGALFYRDSLLSTAAAGLSVHAPRGSAGIAYVGYQSPDQVGGSELWVGRALVRAPAGRWARVEATTLRYAWTLVDMDSGATVGAPRTDGSPTVPVASVRDFARTHGGDGAGFYSVGFGCDGRPFSMDAWRVGARGAVTTYDLEGLTTATTIAADGRQVRPGQAVTLDGSVRLGNGQRVLHGTLLLESRPLGGGRWKIEEVVDAADTDPSVRVRPTESTAYRWRFVDRPLAEGSQSREVVVTVLAAPSDPPEPPQLPAPSDGPDDASEGPDDRPSEGAEDEETGQTEQTEQTGGAAGGQPDDAPSSGAGEQPDDGAPSGASPTAEPSPDAAPAP